VIANSRDWSDLGIASATVLRKEDGGNDRAIPGETLKWHEPSAGPSASASITFDGGDIHTKRMDINKFRSRIGFVFQQFNLFPHLSVLQNVAGA
jgi:hypothetical protein